VQGEREGLTVTEMPPDTTIPGILCLREVPFINRVITTIMEVTVDRRASMAAPVPTENVSANLDTLVPSVLTVRKP